MPAPRMLSATRTPLLWAFLLLGTGTLPALETPPVPPAPPAKLPEGVEPLAKEVQQKIDRLEASAVHYRGLPLKNHVAMGQQGREQLKRKFLEEFKEEYPPEVLESMQKALNAFGLIPQDMILAKYYPELLTSQVGGYYDPKRKYLVLVQDGAEGMNAQMAKQFGQDVADQMDEVTMVHEIGHAIQDQHFNLEKFVPSEPLADSTLARLALVEGDATLVGYDHLLKAPMERMPMVEQSMKMMEGDLSQISNLMPDMPDLKKILEAPAYIRENLLFSYTQGLSFCIHVRKAGGQKLLDYAFTKDPPRSTEQILHPEKWAGRRDDPVVLKLPDLSPTLAGYKKVSAGSWGEFNTRLLLLEKLGKKAKRTCEVAAAGWGGDAFALYRKEGQEVLVWVSEWDTLKDAQEFEAAAKSAFREGWTIGNPAPTRITLIRGALDPETQKKVTDQLSALTFDPPENRDLDLAALGITEKDKPKPMGLADLQGLMDNPNLKKMMQGMLGSKKDGEDLTKLLDNPEVQDMAKNMAKEMLGEEAGGMVGEMLKNPEMQKMMKDMLKTTEAPKGSVEDGLYRNEGVGIAIRKPTAEGWALIDKPEKPPIGPAPLVEFSGPAGQARVMVAQQDLPMQVPIEMMGPMLEMGPKMQFKDFKKVKGDFITVGSQKGFELEFTGSADGSTLHLIQQVFIRDGKMLLIMATSEQSEWEKSEKGIREALGSFKFIEKKTPKERAPKEEKAPDNQLKE